jgi:hypothetical protein
MGRSCTLETGSEPLLVHDTVALYVHQREGHDRAEIETQSELLLSGLHHRFRLHLVVESLQDVVSGR